MSELSLLILALLFVACAVYGFVVLVLKLVTLLNTQSAPPTNAPQRRLDDDVVAAAFLLNHLRQQDFIDGQQFQRIRDYLETTFGDQLELPERLQQVSTAGSMTTASPLSTSQRQSPDGVTTNFVAPIESATASSQLQDDPTAEIVMGELVDPASIRVPVGRAAVESPKLSTPDLRPSGSTKHVAAAPWELPDPPVPAGRRSLADMLSGFMEEKNIRWGELASGILIVCSAIGLVVSLRNELNDTIPYFPALLFLLITAAIQGAGIYTLRKWKLRNTSRGTLLIGLLLIPLNFLAACILTGSEELRKPLTDTTYWFAVAIGVSSFGFMTWWSSRLLLRIGYLPLTIAIMGAAIMTLVINRLDFTGSSSWQELITAATVAVFTAIGAGEPWCRNRRRKSFSSRNANRQFILLGLSVFAFAAATSLIPIRTADNSHALVAIAPAATAVLMMIAAVGASILTNTHGNGSTTQKIAGQALLILGVVLSGVSLIVSASNPTIMLMNGIVAAASLWQIAHRQNIPSLLLPAWASLAVSVICGASLIAGSFSFDSWETAEAIRLAFVSGRSGLSLLALSAVIAGLSFCFPRDTSAAMDSVSTLVDSRTRFHLISAGSIAGCGCLLALIAGMINRTNVFDTMTASVLLLLASVVLLRLALTANVDGLATLATLIVFIFFAFSFLWNPTTSAWIEPFCFGLNAAWVYVFAGVAVTAGIAASISARRVNGDQVASATSELGRLAAVTSTLSIVGGLIFVNSGTGLSSVTVALALIAWMGIAISHRNAGVKRVNYSICMAMTTGLLLSIAVYEFASKMGWPGNQTVEHWLIQFIVLAAWSTIWSLSAIGFSRSRTMGWIFNNQRIRGDQIVLAAVLAAVLIVVGGRLFEATGRELSASFISRLSPIGDIATMSAWSIATAAVAVLASQLKQNHAIKWLWLIGLYVLGWALAAAPFDGSLSAASATRWLLPLGAIVAAGLSFQLHRVERLFPNQELTDDPAGKEDTLRDGRLNSFVDPTTQRQLLINLFLTISAVIVLAISSFATAQVLMTEAGVKSLGGPIKSGWFGSLPAEINYGVPGGIMTTAILMFAISQRRSWLAFAGSAIYQYVVLFSILMLILSVHPALATERFVQTLQAVSLGMTGYGLIWFWQRHRIGDTDPVWSLTRSWKIRQIELHTLINCILVTSLAVLIVCRFFRFPDQPGGWINMAGGPAGLLALMAVSGLTYLVWRVHSPTKSSSILINWLYCWAGLVFVSMLATIVDKSTGGGTWIGFRFIMWGSIVVATALNVMAWLYVRNAKSTCAPVLLASVIALLFGMRGAWNDSPAFVQYIAVIGLVVLLTTVVGLVTRRALPSLISATAVVMGGHTLSTLDPGAMFSAGIFDSINLVLLGLVVVSLVWSGFYAWRSYSNEESPNGFAILPNAVLLLSSIWVFCGALLEWLAQSDPRPLSGNSPLAYPWGLAAVLAPVALAGVHLWCERRRFHVVSGFLWTVGVAILLAAVIADEVVSRNVWIMFAVSLAVAVWGIVWLNRERCLNVAGKLKIPKLDKFSDAMRGQLPICALIVGSILLLAATASILQTESRSLRFLTAMTPLSLAAGIGFLADQRRQRWMQILSLVLATIGCVFVGWADFSPVDIQTNPLRLAIRSLLVLAGAMFLYGVFVSRWVREGDSWIKSLREMAVATCAAALLCLATVVMLEGRLFVEDVGCGLSVAESIAAAAVVLGMIVGLVIIAVRPKHDPFSLSLTGRMGYVYTAELAGVMFVFHLYFSMPWLFQFGIKAYWPYIMMALAFGGVGMGQLLEKRKLTVLGQPIFHTAAILPVLVSALFWAVDSQADAALVLMTAGLAYMLISYTHHSILSGAAAVVLGNLALWVFYDRFPGFSFLAHPQLWLIPPALSLLVAGHLAADSLSKGQLATLRYLCVSVIYISSTSEIFISGIGDRLWPPMLLAVLSVMGILLGIMFQIRAYLFLGALFLFMAMVTMVSHAHQKFDHVWPWWAFGIGMGIAILAMFGWFESRRTRMKAIAQKLQKWEL